MKIVRVVSSEAYHVVRADQLTMIEHLAKNRTSEKDMYPFPSVKDGRKVETDRVVILEAHCLHFSYSTVLHLLKRAINIASATDEGLTYTLKEVFGAKPAKVLPPGSLRFYSQKLICFWTGKNWRRITP